MEAQREAVTRYVHDRGQILAEYVEVESGRKHKNRPQLLAALEHCKKAKATLVIARLDRLARNVAFISALLESNVQFICCDNPHATKTMLQLLAVFAEHERDQISERTKAALAAAKARGVKLGNPRYEEALKKARAARGYDRPSEQVLELMRQWRQQDATLREIGMRLDNLGIPAPAGVRWHSSTIYRALKRMNASTQAPINATTIALTDECVLSSFTPHFRLHTPGSGAIPSVFGPSAGRRPTPDGELTMAELADSFRMIDTFASAGATHFDVTFTDIEGEKVGFRKEQTARQLRNSLPHLLPGLTERRQNLIVRPQGPHVTFIQLDDLDYEQLKQVSPISCLILETSPGNHQAWVAVSDLHKDEAKDFGCRLRKGTSADINASGATRCAGTHNYKVKYLPDFPEVKILLAAPGRMTTKAQLEAFHILAASEPVHEAAPVVIRTSASRSWPDYQRCVDGAPLNHSKTGPDISRADYFWSMMCAQRGHGMQEIAAHLMELSSKAKTGGQRYADRTAQNAYNSVMRDHDRRASRA